MKIVLFKIGIRVSTPKPCFIILTLGIIKPVKSALNKQKINLKSGIFRYTRFSRKILN